MKIEIEKETGFLQSFANQLGVEIEKGNIIRIPEKFGKGYIRGFGFDSGIRMMIRNYELYEDLKINRRNSGSFSKRIIVSFNDVFATKSDNFIDKKSFPSVQAYSGNIDSELILPRKTKYQSIIIGIEISYLKTLVDSNSENLILKSITNDERTFLFEEFMSPQIQKVANEIIDVNIPFDLQNFYFKVKAEELICLLFVELLKRENTNVSALNTNDIQAIYTLRDKILATIDTPPVLADLALQTGMSVSKLKRLFKQIFGDSIFNYYRSFRMKEAARLLREKKLSVSEVGYQLGFTNLSHFTKVFEQHTGMKPKKYSNTNFIE